MRVPVPLAWLLLLLTLFTAGLLRQYNDHTPTSPFVAPVVGSLLFAGILLLLLVTAREFRRGAIPGPGIRLGSLTPVLLMLLGEKWIAITLYVPLFYWIASADGSPEMLDAQFRAFAGVGLLLVCLLLARLSAPTARKTWRRARPARWPMAALATGLVVGATYLMLGAAAWALGGEFELQWPEPKPLLFWILGGQLVLAFAEELYFRGLLMSEMERLAPRLGARRAMARRWIALLTTSIVFGMEHTRWMPDPGQAARQMVFTVALGLLFGLLIMASANLPLAAGLHAWINWLLLGAAPYFVDRAGAPALPTGTYIGPAMILAFSATYLYRRSSHRRL